jgi:hypothetical protein
MSKENRTMIIEIHFELRNSETLKHGNLKQEQYQI